MFSKNIFWCAIVAVLASVTHAHAESTLSVGLSADVTSLDPYYQNVDINNSVAEHVFDRLVTKDETEHFGPGLALSWTNDPANPKTWYFELRKDVSFHNGKKFTANDVICSYRRAAKGAWQPHVGMIAKMTADSDTHLTIETSDLSPTLPNSLALVPIISCEFESASKADFDAGTAMVGTGPLRFVTRNPGHFIQLKKNNSYWNQDWVGSFHWTDVLLKIIPSSQERVAALQANGVDLIANVAAEDIPGLKNSFGFSIFSSVSSRLIFLQMDVSRAQTPFVTDLGDQPVKNPFKNAKFRRALTLLINRDAIVKTVMGDQAIPAGQLVPPGTFGHDNSLYPVVSDTAQAKQLLLTVAQEDADLAYVAKGFKITLHSPNNRYVNDAAAANQIVTQLNLFGVAAGINIQATVVTMPIDEFLKRSGFPNYEFSFMLDGWAADTGEASISLKNLLGTWNYEPDWGMANRGRYTNAQLDQVTALAERTLDEGKREGLLIKATEIGIEDVGILPLHFQMNNWATRKGFSYKPRVDEHTHAYEVF